MGSDIPHQTVLWVKALLLPLLGPHDHDPLQRPLSTLWTPSRLTWVLTPHSGPPHHSDALQQAKPVAPFLKCPPDTIKLQHPTWSAFPYWPLITLLRLLYPVPCEPFSHPIQDPAACAGQLPYVNVLPGCVSSKTAHWVAPHVEALHTNLCSDTPCQAVLRPAPHADAFLSPPGFSPLFPTPSCTNAYFTWL